MSSSDSEDNFVSYGTPLEPLEEDEIPKKRPRLLEDQTVTDKQGRRRFHGAFTGGFSAGFFNTVGSLEGWKPTSFRSSKSDKHTPLEQKPEDYMDEEDRSEFGIAPLILRTKEDYVNSNKKSVPCQSNKTNFGAYIFHNILKPVRETVGLKLLAVMGWKPGQGIGPRRKKSEKKKMSKMRQKVYGCQPAASQCSDEGESESDSELGDITFAPVDYEPYLVAPKTNFFGIGYEGLQRHTVADLSTQSTQQNFLLEISKRKLNIKGQAFGVGAFEEDDDDIYAKDDLHQYDFTLTTDTDKEEKHRKSSVKRDDVIEGFTPQVKRITRMQYQLPVLPKNFKCVHKFKTSRFNKVEEDNPLSKQLSNKQNSDVSRCNIRRSALDDDKTVEEAIHLPFTSSHVEQYNFQPFCFDLEKQKRFEKYLKLVDEGKKEDLNALQPLNMTDWAREREKLEFDQASRLLKPLTGALTNRFQPASQPDDLSDPLAVVDKFCEGNEDCIKAAKMKMYGKLTRSEDEWIPCPLLSKRFNIPELKTERFNTINKTKHVQNARITLFGSTTFVKPELESLERISQEKPDQTRIEIVNSDVKENTETETISLEHVSSKNETVNLDAAGVNVKTNPLESTSSKVDLFKAIFLDSDDENEQEKEIEKEKEQTIQYEEVLINNKRNTSPPRGIFENIELERFEIRNISVKDNQSCDALEKSVENKMNDDLPSDAVYGPKIPQTLEIKQNCSRINYIEKEPVDNSCWIESNLKVKKEKKKDKKHKKSKHKSKHKKKKKKKSEK